MGITSLLHGSSPPPHPLSPKLGHFASDAEWPEFGHCARDAEWPEFGHCASDAEWPEFSHYAPDAEWPEFGHCASDAKILYWTGAMSVLPCALSV